ncbi:hypothetical protein [Bradyrhizobium sp. Cp5.3]|uniref:hypothetical protein n=1 Tax=Bradyrhizobium sp. Cp5.3 TaxID=443598 RepID=UPI0004130BFE|nr:hypothetical protein [Bradyrhizobium sp. Cp5.3]
MLAAFMQIAMLVLAIRFGWLAFVGLQSGVVSSRPRYGGPTRQFSRATKPGAFWITVVSYLVFAAAVVAGDIIRLAMIF